LPSPNVIISVIYYDVPIATRKKERMKGTKTVNEVNDVRDEINIDNFSINESIN
jgi:hypothetical protein